MRQKSNFSIICVILLLLIGKLNAYDIGANSQIWLKANSGLTKDGSDNWIWDNIPNNNDFFIYGTNPVLNVDNNKVFNFNPTFTLDGSNGFFVPWAPTNGEKSSIFVVQRNNILDPFQETILEIANLENGNNLYRTRVFLREGDVRFLSRVDVAISRPYDEHPVNVLHLQNEKDVNRIIYSNNKKLGENGVANTITPDSNPYTSFGFRRVNDNYSLFYGGEIAELIVLTGNDSQDSQVIRRINSYLALKYGATLVNSSYTDGSNNTIWVKDAVYKNNIIALGKDSLTSLDQRVSKSVETNASLSIATSSFTDSFSNTTYTDTFSSGDYFVVANDGGDIAFNSNAEFDNTLFSKRIDREWKVQKSGTNQDIYLKVEGLASKQTWEKYALVWDADGDFTSGSVEVALSEDGKFQANSSVLTSGYFTIMIKNNAPTGISLSVNSINENSALDTEVASLIAIDNDANDTYIYEFVDGVGGEDNAKFTIQANKLKTNALFNYESPNDLGDTSSNNTYALKIKVTDALGASAIQNLVVNVNDINEAPTLQDKVITVEEHNFNNTVLGQMVVDDEDNGGNYTYSILSGNDRNAYYIDPTTGEIKIQYRVFSDFENPDTKTSNLVVEVDNDGLKDTANVTINLTNVDYSYSVNKTNVTINENAGTATFTVVFDQRPIGDKKINIVSSNTNNITVSKSVLTFLAGEWDTPQTVTITAVDDNIQSLRDAKVTVSIDETNENHEFIGLGSKEINVTLNDDDTAGFNLSATSLVVNENAGVGSFDITLATKPSSDVVFDFVVDNTEIEAIPSVTFTPNDPLSKTINFTAVNDDVVNTDVSDIKVKINASSASEYTSLNPNEKTVNVTLTDDDTAGLVVSALSQSSISENAGTSSFTVKLASKPTSNVVINLSKDSTKISFDKNFLTFTSQNWNVAQTVNITAIDNDVVKSDSDIITISVNDESSSNEYDVLADETLSLTLIDDDIAGILPMHATGNINEGNVKNIGISLSSKPLSNVVLNISNNSDYSTLNKTTITFTPENWNVGEQIVVTSKEDSIDRGTTYSETIVISVDDANSDDTYDLVSDKNINITYNDNDEAGLIFSTKTFSVDENASINGTLKLKTQPSSNVTVNFVSSNTAEATVTSSLTFTSSNWNTEQNFIINGIDDSVFTDDSANINVTLSGSDTIYSALSDTLSATVVNTDVESLDISNITLGGTSISEKGEKKFQLRLGSDVTNNDNGVKVNLTSNSLSEVTISPSSINFPAGEGTAYVEVTISAVDDNINRDDTGSVTISVDPTSDSDYTSIADQTINLTFVDDDEASYTMSALNSDSINEGTSTTFTLKLNTQPVTYPVVFDISSTSSLVSFSQDSVSFNDWTETKTITVLAVEDSIDNNETNTANIKVAVNASSSSDEYDSLLEQVKILTIADNDVVGFTLSKSTLSINEGDNDTFTVVLDAQPSSDVVIDLASDNSDVVLDKQTLTFTNTNWNTPQTVQASVNDDEVNNGSVYSASITASVNSSSDDTFDSLASKNITVSINDNDSSNFFVSTSTISLAENEQSSSFSVSLTSNPVSDVEIDLSVNNTNEISLSKQKIIFNSTNWNIPQVVTVQSIEDLKDSDDSAEITLSVNAANSSDEFDGLLDKKIDVTIVDNDTADFEVNKTQIAIDENNGVDVFEVVLKTEPLSDVVLDLSVGTNDEVSLDKTSLTFTPQNWNNPQTVMVSSVNDELLREDSEEIIVSVNASLSSDEYDALVSKKVDVVILEDEIATMTIGPDTIITTGLIMKEDADTKTFNLVLGAAPVSAVYVNVLVDSNELSTSYERVIFTKDNWNVEQEVVLTSINDNFDRDDETTVSIAIDASSDSAFTSIQGSDVNVKLIDDDTAQVLSTVDSLVINEVGTKEFKLKLNSKPLSNVTLNFTSSDTSKIANPSSVTFEPNGWNNEKTIQLTALDDMDSLSENISLSIDVDASSDDVYKALSSQSINITILDDEVDNLVIGNGKISDVSISLSEDNESKIVPVVLASAPSSDVIVNISSSNESEVVVDNTSLTFTASNWNIIQELKVTTIDDNVKRDDTASVSISLSNLSDESYKNIVPNNINVSILDNDTVGYVVDNNQLLISEGLTRVFNIKLSSEPLSDVVFDIVIDSDKFTASTNQVSFNSTDWNENQTITVTAVDDNLHSLNSATLTISVNDENSHDNFDPLASKTISLSAADDETSLDTIINYASSNTNKVPLLEDYLDSGLSDIDSNNLGYVNTYINSLDKTSVDTISKVQKAIDHVNALIEVLEDSKSINGSNNANNQAITLSLLNNINGLENLDINNISKYQEAIANAENLSTLPTIEELNTLILKVNSKSFIEKYAEDSSNVKPSIENYENSGVTGVDVDNIDEVNRRVSVLNPEDVNTKEKIQAIVDEVNALREVYEDSISGSSNANTTKVTIEQLRKINGLVNIDESLFTKYQEAIANANNLSNLPTVQEIQELISKVNSNSKIDDFVNGNSNTNPEVDDYKKIGIDGVDDNNIKFVNKLVGSKGIDGIQNIIDLLNKVDEDIEKIEDFKTFVLELNMYFNEGIEVSANSSDEQIVIAKVENEALVIQSQKDKNGEVTITKVLSFDGEMISKNFKVIVNAVNDAPRFTEETRQLINNNIDLVSNKDTLNITIQAVDLENDEISYEAVTADTNKLEVSINEITGELSINAVENQEGIATITIKAVDVYGAENIKYIIVNLSKPLEEFVEDEEGNSILNTNKADEDNSKFITEIKINKNLNKTLKTIDGVTTVTLPDIDTTIKVKENGYIDIDIDNGKNSILIENIGSDVQVDENGIITITTPIKELANGAKYYYTITVPKDNNEIKSVHTLVEDSNNTDTTVYNLIEGTSINLTAEDKLVHSVSTVNTNGNDIKIISSISKQGYVNTNSKIQGQESSFVSVHNPSSTVYVRVNGDVNINNEETIDTQVVKLQIKVDANTGDISGTKETKDGSSDPIVSDIFERAGSKLNVLDGNITQIDVDVQNSYEVIVDVTDSNNDTVRTKTQIDATLNIVNEENGVNGVIKKEVETTSNSNFVLNNDFNGQINHYLNSDIKSYVQSELEGTQTLVSQDKIETKLEFTNFEFGAVLKDDGLAAHKIVKDGVETKADSKIQGSTTSFRKSNTGTIVETKVNKKDENNNLLELVVEADENAYSKHKIEIDGTSTEAQINVVGTLTSIENTGVIVSKVDDITITALANGEAVQELEVDGKVSKAEFKLAGAKTVVNENKDLETKVNEKDIQCANSTEYKNAVVKTKANGETITSFEVLSCSDDSLVETIYTLDNEEVFKKGNEVEVQKVNDSIQIRTKFIMNANEKHSL